MISFSIYVYNPFHFPLLKYETNSTHEKLIVISGITHLKINRLNEHRFSKNRYSLEEEEEKEEEGSKKGGTRTNAR